jgi:transposase-like protein
MPDEETTTKKVLCKYCGSEGVSKYGTYKGVQRYYCKACKRKFKLGDTTFHMKTPANKLSSALNMYHEGISVNTSRWYLSILPLALCPIFPDDL